MNIIELGMIATPVCGAVGGGTAVRNSGSLTTLSALVVGGCVGIGVIALIRFLIRVWPTRVNLERPQWLAPLVVVFLMPVLLPILAFLLSRTIVSAGFHL